MICVMCDFAWKLWNFKHSSFTGRFPNNWSTRLWSKRTVALVHHVIAKLGFSLSNKKMGPSTELEYLWNYLGYWMDGGEVTRRKIGQNISTGTAVFYQGNPARNVNYLVFSVILILPVVWSFLADRLWLSYFTFHQSSGNTPLRRFEFRV